ncbi:MAG: transaldolase [Bacteroidetes bacterium]|nr:transaldolase [Bacteroidota bacterium]
MENLKEAEISSKSLDDAVVCLATASVAAKPSKTVKLVSHPLTKALKESGTQHIYTDTADRVELDDLLTVEETENSLQVIEEIDGNTTNQVLVARVLDRYLGEGEDADIVDWVKVMQTAAPGLSLSEAIALIYTIINGQLGRNLKTYYGTGKDWEISLELHTNLAPRIEDSKRIGRHLVRMLPGSFVKVAFTPHHPHAFLIARDLEREGIPVNFTTTFSARQVAAAAILSNVTRTNIFMGRLNQGLESELLGEQVDLVAQRTLNQLRDELNVKTQLIVASIRSWKTMVYAAGCDVFTVPYPVLKEFLNQTEVGANEIRSRINDDYSDNLGTSQSVLDKVDKSKLECLYTVEPEFIEFLKEVRNGSDFDELDGEGFYQKFAEAGYDDMFYSPTEDDWQELKKNKLPDLDSQLTEKLPLDTLYSLLAFADFTKFQDEMDERIANRIRRFF